jgi:hypothetical protein
MAGAGIVVAGNGEGDWVVVVVVELAPSDSDPGPGIKVLLEVDAIGVGAEVDAVDVDAVDVVPVDAVVDGNELGSGSPLLVDAVSWRSLYEVIKTGTAQIIDAKPASTPITRTQAFLSLNH